VIHQPVVKARRAAGKAGRRQQQEGVVGSTGRKIPITPSATLSQPMASSR
jgi:hypothetical protein